MDKSKFPSIEHSIADFLTEEEANISRKKIISVGSLLILVTLMLSSDILAAHKSHVSHSSHSSHSSGQSTYHSSHVSHESHESHASSSETHPSSTYSHSNVSDSYSHSNASDSAAPVQDQGNWYALLPDESQSETITREIPTYDAHVPQTPPDSPTMDFPEGTINAGG